MIISINAEKAFDKFNTAHDKNSQKNRNREELPQRDRKHLQKNLDANILNGERLLPSKMGNEAKMSTLSIVNQRSAEVLAGGKRQKEIKGIQLEKYKEKK